MEKIMPGRRFSGWKGENIEKKLGQQFSAEFYIFTL
jgi:hypothetical protein